jgi:hypothetical protein
MTNMIAFCFDTGCIYREGQVAKNLDSRNSKVLVDFCHKNGYRIFTSDASMEDMFGEELNKIKPEAFERQKNMHSISIHLPTEERDSLEKALSDSQIEIFKIFFNITNIENSKIDVIFKEKSANDRQDFRILLDALASYHKIIFFVTLNSRDFTRKKEVEINRVIAPRKIFFRNPSENIEKEISDNFSMWGLLD